MTVRFHDSAHPLFQTTDTFQQLIQDLNHFGDNVDSDMKYLDSAIGPGGTLSLNGLGDFTANTIVDALNELDSDLHGVGGGNAKADLTTNAKAVVDAINEIEAVFDASAKKINTTGDFTIDIAAGDIILDAGGADVLFKDDGTTYIKYTMGATNTVAVTGNYTLDVSADIVLDADGGDIDFKDAGVTRFAFGLGATNTLDITGGLTQTSGNYQNTITGTRTINVSSGHTDSASSRTINTTNAVAINAGTTANMTAGTTATVTAGTDITLDANGDITLDANGADVLFKDNGTQYAALTNNSGEVIFKNSSSEVFRGDSSDIVIKRAVQLPTSGTGTPVTSTKTLHGALSDINSRIPNVYDRNGTLLNPLP